jgi:hypothetical protein
MMKELSETNDFLYVVVYFDCHPSVRFANQGEMIRHSMPRGRRPRSTIGSVTIIVGVQNREGATEGSAEGATGELPQ